MNLLHPRTRPVSPLVHVPKLSLNKSQEGKTDQIIKQFFKFLEKGSFTEMLESEEKGLWKIETLVGRKNISYITQLLCGNFQNQDF